jgi:hypothetical protein
MYRYRYRVQVRVGHFREHLANLEALNELARKRGWPETNFWVPTAGMANEFIGEIDYPDLATFERVREESGADAQAMGLMRSGIEHLVEGSARSEILETPGPIPSA